MPFVTVNMITGKTDKQKEMLIKGITKAFEDAGIKPEDVTILLHETPRHNWGIHGIPASKSSS